MLTILHQLTNNFDIFLQAEIFVRLYEIGNVSARRIGIQALCGKFANCLTPSEMYMQIVRSTSSSPLYA